MDTAAEGGIDFLDTADVYPLGGGAQHGRAHRGDRRQLAGRQAPRLHRRHQVRRPHRAASAWDQGMSRKHILDAIDASLKRLQTDYVDLYQLHSYDPTTPIDEALEALDTVVKSGKARYVGVSNWPAYQGGPRRRPQRAEGLGRASPRCSRATTCCSAPSSATCCRCAARKGIGVIPYNPLAGGMLTGKHDRRARRRKARASRSATPAPAIRSATGTTASSRRVEALKGVAAEAGMSMATMAVSLGAGQPGDHRARSSAPAAPSSSPTA